MPSHRAFRRHAFRSCLLFCVLCASAASPSFAGPLNPPAGPIGPTPGPEPRIAINATNTPGDASSQFRIAQPGSYYLTGNIAGVVGRSAIEIAASGVTLDLMGFEVAGVAGSLDGVGTDGVARSTLVVRNGTIRGWGDDGLDLAAADSVLVERVISRQNTGSGILVNANGTLDGCVCTLNGGDGFETNEACVLRACVAANNAGEGFAVIAIGSGTFTDCVAEANGSFGFHGFGSYTFESCVARDNLSDGFFVGQQGATVLNCWAENNSGDGFFVLTGTVTGCSSRGNDLVGINVLTGSIIGCFANGNGDHGIRLEARGIVRDCVSRSNGTAVTDGAGVHVLSGDAQVHDNNCALNDRGIDIAGAGNVITRNTCAGNTANFVIVANNIYGPIIDRTAPASAAVNGSAAAGTMGSTDSNANYSY